MSAHQPRKAHDFLKKIAKHEGLEGLRDRARKGGGLEGLRDADHEVVTTTISKVMEGRDLQPHEQFALEAIIIPDKRPVIDVKNDSYGVIADPLWSHLSTDAQKRKNIELCLPSIGRLEVTGIPSLPYGGTGFVVGKNLLMTNRHVAELFTNGLGTSLVFKTGLGAGIDFKQERGGGAGTVLNVRRARMIHPYWDMALLEVEGLTNQHPMLTLSADDPGTLLDQDVVIVGYPGFDPRNPSDVQNRVFDGVYYVKRMQPGKAGQRRDVESFDHEVSALTHDASTLGGNSGSAVIDPRTGRVVGLHFSGVYLDANFAVPTAELARDERILRLGVNFPRGTQPDRTTSRTWWESLGETAPATPSPSAVTVVDTGEPKARGRAATWRIPLEITVSLGGLAMADGEPSVAIAATEKMMAPVHDEDYSNREGYQADFLGIDVPLPRPSNKSLCAKTIDGEHIIPYHHFSLAMHKKRRLALFTASNVDGSIARRTDKHGKKYTRKGLTGLGPSDVEQWFTDPRLDEAVQLPDRFFTKDNGAFDKGHLVRREDVAWGDSFEEARDANGDTYHTTNCSPQVAGFNRPEDSENWGDLEKYVSAQGDEAKLCVFAGPVLADGDPIFVGVDGEGPVRIQIPQKFWKVIVAADTGVLQSFAFVLEQDLSGVPTEFVLQAPWVSHMLSIKDLENLVGHVRFDEVIHQADQAGTATGEAVRKRGGVKKR